MKDCREHVNIRKPESDHLSDVEKLPASVHASSIIDENCSARIGDESDLSSMKYRARMPGAYLRLPTARPVGRVREPIIPLRPEHRNHQVRLEDGARQNKLEKEDIGDIEHTLIHSWLRFILALFSVVPSFSDPSFTNP